MKKKIFSKDLYHFQIVAYVGLIESSAFFMGTVFILWPLTCLQLLLSLWFFLNGDKLSQKADRAVLAFWMISIPGIIAILFLLIGIEVSDYNFLVGIISGIAAPIPFLIAYRDVLNQTGGKFLGHVGF